MAEDFASVLKSVRAHAEEMKSLAASALAKDSYPEFWRYASDLAARWNAALAADELDWAELGRLREEARTEHGRAGIWLFAWCNGLESDYVALRAASLSLQELRGSARHS